MAVGGVFAAVSCSALHGQVVHATGDAMLGLRLMPSRQPSAACIAVACWLVFLLPLRSSPRHVLRFIPIPPSLCSIRSVTCWLHTWQHAQV